MNKEQISATQTLTFPMCTSWAPASLCSTCNNVNHPPFASSTDLLASHAGLNTGQLACMQQDCANVDVARSAPADVVLNACSSLNVVSSILSL